MNNRDPFVYKTTDYGKTWKLITNGIPKTPLRYAHVVREDPVRRGLLYARHRERALRLASTTARHWQPLQSDLPHAPVYWLMVQEHFNDLVIATYGRGFCILDDITPLRTMNADVAAKDVHLFTPRDAYRFRSVEWPFISASEKNPNYGETAPEGAPVNFWLKAAGKTDSATLTIADASGATVRTMKVRGEGRAQSRLVGLPQRPDRRGADPRQSAVLAVDGHPAGGEAGAELRPLRAARAAREVHGDAGLRREDRIAAADRAQGPGVGRQRGGDRRRR